MWDRGALKYHAREVLKRSYWKAFVASLLLTLVTGGGQVVRNFSATKQASEGSLHGVGGFGVMGEHLMTALLFVLPVILVVLFLSGVVGIAIGLFVCAPLEVGAQRFFLESTQSRFQLGELGYAFDCGGYRNIVLTMFLRGLYTFLWSLLFLIPGLVKHYSYRMVPFLLVENPKMLPSRAIELSGQMTQGHKWSMFVLDLSFFGWYILGALALGIGVFFVHPYVYATQAQLYLALRGAALEQGMTSLDELMPPRNA
ncbi:MAG: DUF975 family protein [Oscillospiraceae bacterium]